MTKLEKEQEVLKSDYITKAVDECNKILSKFGLKVGKLRYDKKGHTKFTTIPLMCGKIVTKETYQKLRCISLGGS